MIDKCNQMVLKFFGMKIISDMFSVPLINNVPIITHFSLEICLHNMFLQNCQKKPRSAVKIPKLPDE